MLCVPSVASGPPAELSVSHNFCEHAMGRTDLFTSLLELRDVLSVVQRFAGEFVDTDESIRLRCRQLEMCTVIANKFAAEDLLVQLIHPFHSPLESHPLCLYCVSLSQSNPQQAVIAEAEAAQISRVDRSAPRRKSSWVKGAVSGIGGQIIGFYVLTRQGVY